MSRYLVLADDDDVIDSTLFTSALEDAIKRAEKLAATTCLEVEVYKRVAIVKRKVTLTTETFKDEVNKDA